MLSTKLIVRGFNYRSGGRHLHTLYTSVCQWLSEDFGVHHPERHLLCAERFGFDGAILLTLRKPESVLIILSRYFKGHRSGGVYMESFYPDRCERIKMKRLELCKRAARLFGALAVSLDYENELLTIDNVAYKYCDSTDKVVLADGSGSLLGPSQLEGLTNDEPEYCDSDFIIESDDEEVLFEE
jgi:hypothetical protein